MSRIKIGRATPEDMAQDARPAEHVDLARRSSPTATSWSRPSPRTRRSRRRCTASWPAVLKPDAILASNTSTISITRMAESAPDPTRFVGMHFFYPVDRMELVEVIRGEKTSDETVATIVALAKRIRKTPIVVKDCPGFLVNRVLFPYMNEALLLLQEGVADGRDRQGGDEVRHADGPDRAGRPGRARHGLLRRPGACSRRTPTAPCRRRSSTTW